MQEMPPKVLERQRNLNGSSGKTTARKGQAVEESIPLEGAGARNERKTRGDMHSRKTQRDTRDPDVKNKR